jgi:predicted DsbA family dithiol-disulfide isomerase
MHVDIISDVVCPWCYIGKRRFERALAQRPGLAVTRSWRAFQLNPDLPADGVPRSHYLAAKYGSARQAGRTFAALRSAGHSEDIDFAFDRIGRMPNTVRAHRMILLAADAGCADEIVEALFRAYFREGLDIGDLDTLAAIGACAGLEWPAVRAYLAGEAGADAVRAEDRRARRLGIHAVPCFVLGRDYAISGAQEPEMFLPLFDVAAGLGNRSLP